MGCDIHAILEHTIDNKTWHASSVGPYGIMDRDYEMFGLLAGVREYSEDSLEPKGFPDDASITAKSMYYNYNVVDDDSPLLAVQDYISESKAREFVEKHGCRMLEEKAIGKVFKSIESPDWHSASYLSEPEYKAVCRKYKKKNKRLPLDYEQLLLVMKQCAGNGINCRVVFWFDS